MDSRQTLEQVNRAMIGFDLVLGAAALLAPRPTLRALGHDDPSPDAEHLFRRCAPIWLTFVGAHVVAAARGAPRDWWALAWLRGTEVATDVVWSRSAAWSRTGARPGLWAAGLANLAMAIGFGALARR
jgi:hypothetical protein